MGVAEGWFWPCFWCWSILALLLQHWHSLSGSEKANERGKSQPCQKWDAKKAHWDQDKTSWVKDKSALPLVKYAVHAGSAFQGVCLGRMLDASRTLHMSRCCCSCCCFRRGVHLRSTASLRCDETNKSLKQPDTAYFIALREGCGQRGLCRVGSGRENSLQFWKEYSMPVLQDGLEAFIID